jgi:hypothetical protein
LISDMSRGHCNAAEPAALLQASARPDGVVDRQERTRRVHERDRR